MDHMNQNKFINHSWDVEMAMEDDQIFHHDPSTLINSPPSLWPSFMSSSFPPQTHTQIMIPPPPSSSQIIPPPPPSSSSSSSTLLFGHGHQITDNNNIIIGQDEDHDHQEAEEDQEDQEEEEEEEELGAMKEMMYRIAAMQPVDIDPSTVSKPKRRNIRISDDPQSVAARHRRERISEKIRILQRLVPGGTKLDTASMLDEAIRYVKFLKRQIRLLQSNQCLGDHYNKLSLAAAATTTTTTITTASTSGGAAAALDPILGHNFPFVSFRTD